jgi:hypothetical protein
MARAAFLGCCAALSITLLVQAFLAGVAAMTDPNWWELHRAWVHLFGWLVLPLPACAVLARYPRWLTGASALPIVLLYLQYVWAHLGRNGTWTYGLGVHAVGALILFGTTVSLFIAALLVAPPHV